LVGELAALLDRSDPRAHRREDARGSVRVRGDFHSVPRGFLDDRAELDVAELLRADTVLEREDARRRHALDDLRSVLELRADGGDALIRSVGDALLGSLLEDPRPESRDVGVPS